MKNFKKWSIFLILVLFGTTVLAQDTISEPSQWPQAPYRLFRTRNIWTFIELDTITGRMWQIQFSVQDGGSRGGTILNSRDLAVGREQIPGRFTLHPTSNMWTFILHDQIDGRTWQVQWSNEAVNRFVVPLLQ